MYAEVLFGNGIVAVIYDWCWHATELMERTLNRDLDPSGPSGADAQPEIMAARAAAAKYGGKVIKEVPYEYVEGRIY